MSNITYSEKSKRKSANSVTTVELITKNDCKTEVEGLIARCTEIINLSNNLYQLKMDKHLSDALVTLNLTKDSLELININ